MTDLIHVEPAPEARIALARWAVTQTPKVATVGPNTFAIPADLFSSVPEAALIGAHVDGHRYVSPDEEASVSAEEGTAEAELTGVARPEGLLAAAPGEPLPEVPPESYGPDSTPLPAADAGGDDQEQKDEKRAESEAAEQHVCEECGRPFTSERGLTMHARRVHSG
ncbi:hypothetical protein [Streptomyces sp. NPDC059916]|uniref:hypothetical protein n=1 Tax=Streptomyces sp. NPDC059916 TaxID=3347001 RepID=UPI0036C692BC